MIEPSVAATLYGQMAAILEILDDGNFGPLSIRAEEYRQWEAHLSGADAHTRRFIGL